MFVGYTSIEIQLDLKITFLALLLMTFCRTSRLHVSITYGINTIHLSDCINRE